MGTYKGGSTRYRSISDNIAALKTSYSYSNGYFGIKGQGRSHTRNIISSNPISTAMDFYEKAAYGGIEKTYNKGVYTKLSDGTILSYRKISTSDGTPAVEINIKHSNNSSGLKQQKIHFIMED